MKKTDSNLRTRIFPILVLTMFLSMVGLKSMAQPLLVENFDYSIGALLTANGWTAHSGAGSQAIDVTSGLTYSGYLGTGVGGAALLDNTGEDDSKTMTAVTSGTLYCAALINVTSGPAGYFYHLGGSTSAFAARVFVRPSTTSGKINFGFSNTSTGVYSTTDFDPGTTYLIIIKYAVSTAGDASLWVVSGGLPATEVDAGTPLLTTTGTGQASIDRVCLRQYSSTQNITVDAIRLATTWVDAVTPESTISPTITATPTSLSSFNYLEGSGPSAEQTFTVSGTDLTANVFLAPSTNYEISESSGTGYDLPVELTQTDGTLDPTTVYVRLKAGLTAGTYNGETINITSAGASPTAVTCNGSVTALSPQLTAAPTTLTGFTYAIDNGGPSAYQYYTLSGINLIGFTGNITVTGSTNFEVSNDASVWGSSATVEFTSATLDPTPVFVRLKAGLAEGSYSGELITNSGGDAPSVSVTCSGTVTPPQPTAVCLLRPTHIDLSSATAQSAVLMRLSNYTSSDLRYRLYSGSFQYNCWDESLDVFQSSTSYAAGPQVPGTATSSTTFWILSQRGGNLTGDATYRDRLGPGYTANVSTIALPTAASISTPFSLSGNFVPFGGYDNSIKHVVLAYSSSVLISATSTTLTTGAFALVCPDGVTIDLIEVRAIDNTLIASRTGSWSTTTVVGNVPDLPIVAAPVISPLTGNYYAPFSATITCTTPSSSIYYTTNGTEPDNVGNGTLYTIPIPISATTTLKAKAYATDFDPSIVVTEVYTFPVVVDVADIAALRAGLTDGTAYRLTGEAVLTFKSITRNAKYIQDASGAIMIDDVTGKITTNYNVNDGITGITGTLFVNTSMLQFVPVLDPGAATSTGNIVVPESVTLANLNTTHQAKLVKVNYTTISGSGNFLPVTNYPLTDPSGAGVMRTHYSDLDYIGTAIPVAPRNLTGVVLQFNTTTQLIPRALSDFEVSVDPSLTATPNTLSGFLYAAGIGGPSPSQSYSLEGNNLVGYPGVITITGSANYEVSADDITFGTSATVPFTSATLSPVNVYVRLKAGLTSGAYDGEVIVNNGGGILLPLNVTVSGTVLAGEPTNHASGFTAVSPISSAINLTWNDNDGAQPADGFLVLANTSGTFTAPVDGVAVANDANLGDGSGAMNVAHGVQALTWASLLPGTPYYFVIYPYTNAGALIDYKTTPDAPTATATTQAAALPLAAWTFDATPAAPSTPTSIAANYGNQLTAMFYADGTNGSSLWASTASNPQLSAFGGSTLNDPRPAPTSGNAIALANNSANGQSVVLKFSMTGYENPILTFATRGTSTGFNAHQWAWSTDNVTYSDFGTNTANTTSTFLLRTLDLGSIDAVDQAAEVYIRLTVSGATGATGNNRIDNIVLDATPATPLTKALNVSVFLEGLYESAGTMHKAQGSSGDQFPGTVADKVTIELHDGTTYSTIVHTIPDVDLNQDGSIATTLPAAFSGDYYITIVHRNSITTTTAAPVSFSGGTISYAFDAANKAYGSNLLDKGDGFFVIYGGDVNQDGSIDSGDVTPFDNDQFNYVTGYAVTDVNGDGSIDSGDGTIIDNNQFSYIYAMFPL